MSSQEISHADIAEMVKLITADKKPIKVILFGSLARGDAKSNSDVDLLVIEPDPVAQRKEAARLRKLLRSFKAQIDIVVFGQAFADRY